MCQHGVSDRIAWPMQHKIMEEIRLREDWRELTGRVEINSAFRGGNLSVGKAGHSV
ncbi:hypothetical protein LPH50_05760 [Xylella taiwanensis]|uniref:Uncharacterized protein n=1 Tax=Xylella taiwanensis TaxID=1444770 RepID=Z9JN42_9GAMM|nr:hypothetical protein [Xylella taiwanensis]EWS79423.1 hypothetical protein AF72_00065 [Xylella taiwanensis]MCD8455480.1 hypothetical protein [Xylella taiwanensis]MCD8457885.1 hypothetical protein [Xylella taiwanensis]MCD8460020.1 hypothetical protein [Xylella taiwanensis]MCD8463919.1 hypothetical protein [Xylella taiwanensis]